MKNEAKCLIDEKTSWIKCLQSLLVDMIFMGLVPPKNINLQQINKNGVLRKLLGGLFKSESEKHDQPNIKFGRYNDAYKSKEKYDSWDQGLDLFDKKEYEKAYLSFFDYLNDEEEQNVNHWKENGQLHFEIFHGSKRTKGVIDENGIYAESKIAISESLNVGFLRKLVEQNYLLKYSKYALDENDDLVIVFHSGSIDGSPYKVYYGLKELALNADKQDDLLIDEFEMLKPYNDGHIEELPEDEKDTKYQYLITEIEKVFHEIDHGTLKGDKHPGGISYLLLDLCYRLDYLIKPEGFVMEQLEKVHRTFFANDGRNAAQKNLAIRKEYQVILDRSKEQVLLEFYNVSSTFGITAPADHDRLVGLIDGELGNMKWYVEHKHETIARSIPGYIVSYSLFNYAIPLPDRELLHLYMMVTQYPYFQDLGYKTDFIVNGKLVKREIEFAINRIVARNKGSYPKLKPNFKLLNYDSLTKFCHSYLMMIRELNLSKAEQ